MLLRDGLRTELPTDCTLQCMSMVRNFRVHKAI